MHTSRKHLGLVSLTLTAVAALVACGGGGGADPASAPPLVNFGSTAPLPTDITGVLMTMNCVDGAGWQCSGAQQLRTDNGVTVTNSGVQAYGRSTSDLVPGNANPTTATGLEPASGGTVEMRFKRNIPGDYAVTRAGMIMTNLGITWDGTNPRPPAIEVFDPTKGVTKLNVDGSLSWLNTLPDASDMAYFNWQGLGLNATQANYANNRYFPRTEPVICPPGVATCASTETTGITYLGGAFRAGGTDPDRTTATRLHSDGDIKAGVPPGPPGGVPFAGNKGIRGLVAFSFDYANIGTWATEETVLVDEWAGPGQEHTTNRRGVVAFGEATPPAQVPEAGGVDYAGVVYGWYFSGSGPDLVYYRATATVSVNLDSRQVAIRISNASQDGNSTITVPLAAEVTTGLGAKGSNVANYFTGAGSTSSGADAMTGGIGGRFFGPVAAGRSGNVGPAEIAGSFSLLNSTTKASTVGGFIARRQ